VYSITGYLREAETSFCMDACGIYYLEDESGEFISRITHLDDLEMLEPYVGRFVEIEGEEVTCVTCDAIDVSSIMISDECEFPVECFADPCEVGECPAYPDAECVANYCDGCWADFYINGELLDCSSNVECIDLTGIDFGACDMALGIGWSEEECQYLSGCDWVVCTYPISSPGFQCIYLRITIIPKSIDSARNYYSGWVRNISYSN